MSHLEAFELHQPGDLPALHALLTELKKALGTEARLIAGGTDLLPKLRAGRLQLRHLISLNHIAELRGVDHDPASGLRIGGTARVRDVADHPATHEIYPALMSACTRMATVQVRNMGTVAGNLANASPCADTAGPLLVHDARLQVESDRGLRELPVAQLFKGPGATSLAPCEVIRAIIVPPPAPRSGAAYLRHSARSRVDMAAASAAAYVALDDHGRIADARVALGAVAPTPLRCADAEAALCGQEPGPELFAAAAATAARAASPITDVRASAAYRAAIIPVLARRALAQAVAQIPGGPR